MKKNKSQRLTIGVLFDYFTEKYQNGIWNGIVKAANNLDVNLLFYVGGDIDSPYIHHAPRNLVYKLVNLDNLDGIIVMSATIGNYIRKNRLEIFINSFSSIPTISIGVAFKGIPSIIVDNYAGMHEVIRHLIVDHGFTRLAFIKGTQGNQEAESRFKAYQTILKEYNIPFDPNLIEQGNFYFDSGNKAVTNLIDKKGASFQALIASNDIMAFDAIKELQRRNIHVPYDIAVVGFDDSDEAKQFLPSLTTVSQPLQEIGHTAVSSLLSLLRNEQMPQQIVIPSKLIVRNSCGCSLYKTNIIKQIKQRGNKYILTEKENLDTQFHDIKKDIHDLEIPYAAQVFAGNLIDALHEDLGGAQHDKFLRILDENIKKLPGFNFLHLQVIITYILRKLASSDNLTAQTDYIESLLYHAYEIIWENERNLQTKIKLETESELRDLHVISIDFITAFTIKELKYVITHEFPKLGFDFCAIYRFTVEGKNHDYAKRLIFFDKNIQRKSHKPIHSQNLLADITDLTSAERFAYVIMPLYFKNTKLGFVVFNVNEIPGLIYETLVIQLSGALKGIELMQKIKKHSSELEDKIKERTAKLESAKTELEKMNNELKKLDALKNDFIANITHDFRSPLTAILNIADLALKVKNFDKNESKENFQIIYDASLRLRRSIDNLLNLAKIDAKGIKLKVQNLPLLTFVNHILDFYSSSVIGTGIKIIRVFPHHEIEDIYTDKEKLEEVINNILSNALKFVNPKNGIIKVEIADQPHSVLIKITDNGIGIPKAKLGFIFKRFAQIHANRNTMLGGTGIGLAFSKQLVDYIKAKLWAESEGEGKGATFIIELKKGRDIFSKNDFYNGHIRQMRREDVQSLIQTELKKKQEPNGITTHFSELNKDNEFEYKKAKILIVEDDKTIRQIIIKYLNNYAFKNYIEVSNGISALAAVYDYTPDIIICDYNMPTMRGDIFHDELLSNPQFKNIPFIFLSAIADDDLIMERRLKGACAYLKKPIDDRELFFTVEQQLKKYFEYLKTVQLATLDELTSLYNKRGIDKYLHHELSIRKYRNLSIIFFDIDHFKNVNDKYGHPAGDKVLSSLGELLKSALRDYDIVGRYGGEEFIVICADTNLKQAAIVADMLREKIKNTQFTYEMHTIAVTASFGVASLVDNEKYICKKLKIKSLNDIYEVKDPAAVNWPEIKENKQKIAAILLKMADLALYKAKSKLCSTCGFSSLKNHLFKNSTCPNCNGNIILPARDKVVTFSNSF